MPVTSSLRALGVAVAVASAFLAWPAPALAHSQLKSSNPASGATVRTVLTAVTLTFNEPLLGRYSTVQVTGPGGRDYGVAKPRQVDSTTTQAVAPMGSGDYTVAWRVVSADGHPIEGTVRFTVALPPGQEPAKLQPAAPGAPQDEGRSTAPWALGAGGAALALGVLSYGVWAARRRRTSDHS